MYVAHLEVFKTELTFQTLGLLSPTPSSALPLLYLLKVLLFWSTLHEHTALTRVLMDQPAAFQTASQRFNLCFSLRDNCSWCLWWWTGLIYWSTGLKQRILLHYCYVRNALYLGVFQSFRWKIVNSILSHLWHKNVWQSSRSVAWLKEKPKP